MNRGQNAGARERIKTMGPRRTLMLNKRDALLVPIGIWMGSAVVWLMINAPSVYWPEECEYLLLWSGYITAISISSVLFVMNARAKAKPLCMKSSPSCRTRKKEAYLTAGYAITISFHVLFLAHSLIDYTMAVPMPAHVSIGMAPVISGVVFIGLNYALGCGVKTISRLIICAIAGYGMTIAPWILFDRNGTRIYEEVGRSVAMLDYGSALVRLYIVSILIRLNARRGRDATV